MTTFQWLQVLGFTPDVAAACAMPEVFAANDTLTANDLAAFPARRESPVVGKIFLPDAD